MNYPVKLLLTTSVLVMPSVFADSSISFRDDEQLYSCQSFVSEDLVSCQSFAESRPSLRAISDEKNDKATNLGALEKNAGFQKMLAQHMGSAAYKALYPKMRAILWMEMNKLLNGTGMVALTPEGHKLPVLRGSFDGLFDLILNTLGVNSSIRSGIGLMTTISGHKDYIETELKRLLGFDSLEAFIERLAQETALKSMGLAVELYSSTDRSLTLSEIENVQQSVSVKDGRAEVLSDKAARADLSFATGYVWYELRNIINQVVATSIDAHLAELKASMIRTGKEKLDAVTLGMAGGLISVNGLPGIVPAVAMLALNHTYGSTAIEFGYDIFNQVVTDGLLEARNIAALPINKAEIEEFHAGAITVNTTDEEDTVIVHSIKEESFGGKFLFGAAKNTTSSAVKVGSSIVVSTAKRLTSWFVRTLSY